MKFLRLVWANLKRKKVRTVLTLLSILVAFLLFGYLSAIRQAFNAGVDVAGADRLIVRHKVSIIQFLPESYEAEIEQIPGVAEAAHATWFGGIYQKPSNFFPQMPVKPEEYLSLYPEYILPEDQKQAWFRTRTGAVAGRAIRRPFWLEGWRQDPDSGKGLDAQRRPEDLGVRSRRNLRRRGKGNRYDPVSFRFRLFRRGAGLRPGERRLVLRARRGS